MPDSIRRGSPTRPVTRGISPPIWNCISSRGRAPEQAGLALGVVEAINGARRLNCRFTGEAGHAGTVPMLHRKDALAAAAEWMVQVENLTRQRGGNWWRRSAPCAVRRAR